jgi:UDP-glucuronate decarboxylase
MATGDDTTGPLNLGNPAEISMLQLAQLIISMIESNSEIAFHPLPEDDPVQRQPDITLAKEIIGWQPQQELRAGLEKTIEYFRGVC